MINLVKNTIVNPVTFMRRYHSTKNLPYSVRTYEYTPHGSYYVSGILDYSGLKDALGVFELKKQDMLQMNAPSHVVLFNGADTLERFDNI